MKVPLRRLVVAWKFASRAAFGGCCCAATSAFAQTEHLDRWTADGRIRFLFGYDNCPNLVDMAEKLPDRAWTKLRRPPRYPVAAPARQRPYNVKDAIVKRRQFETLRLRSGE